MTSVKAVLAELIGLFVDDWAFTALVLGWLLAATRLVPSLLPDRSWNGPVLFLGCAAVLALSTWHRGRQRRAGAPVAPSREP